MAKDKPVKATGKSHPGPNKKPFSKKKPTKKPF